VNSGTILIVDDSPSNRDVYSLLLEHYGYSVVRASNGWEGVQLARACQPDLILMDITMPVLDGIEATELLKLDAATRDIPVIGVSAHHDAYTIGRAYAVGMHAYLTKPTPPRRVILEVQRCLLAQRSAGRAHLPRMEPAKNRVPRKPGAEDRVR
jgi:CheY-like chemotaxis protein